MVLPALVVFLLCLLMSAFFSMSETAFIASNPYSIEYQERRGSKRAGRVRKILARTNDFLATILIGNTLVNVAAASIATAIFASFVKDRNEAVLLATITTTLLILIFAEINPKTFAAHNPVRTALALSYPIRVLMALLGPPVKVFSFMTGLVLPSTRKREGGRARPATEEEVRIAVMAGTRGLSALRRRMISGALDIGERPVKEIMVPRPHVKAIDAEASLESVVRTIQASGFSRYPVYRGRQDNIEGFVRAKDVIAYVIDNKSFDIAAILRRPFFVPELASLEKVLVQMQDNAVHMAFVVDEFGTVEGLVTLEDIIEEIVGDIQDERDSRSEECVTPLGGGAYLIKGAAPVKEVNAELSLGIPETSEYTTMAGFFLAEFGRIPREKDAVPFASYVLTVEKMNKRHISLLRLERRAGGEQDAP